MTSFTRGEKLVRETASRMVELREVLARKKKKFGEVGEGDEVGEGVI